MKKQDNASPLNSHYNSTSESEDTECPKYLRQILKEDPNKDINEVRESTQDLDKKKSPTWKRNSRRK
jgi:hypothetical protein